MSTLTSPASRFREYRERAGLSHDDAGRLMGISSASVWDIESHEEELSSCYSPRQVQHFCRVLGIRPVELFGADVAEAAVSAEELVGLIKEQCHSRGVTLEQFGEIVGWQLSACIEPAQRLLDDISIDGLQWLCRELAIDWHRVTLSL